MQHQTSIASSSSSSSSSSSPSSTSSSFAHLGRAEGDITDDFAYLDKFGENKKSAAGPKLLPSQTRTPDAYFTPYLPREDGDEVPEYKVTPFTTDPSDDFAYLENMGAHEKTIQAVDVPLPDAPRPMGGVQGTAATLGTTAEAKAAEAKAAAAVAAGAEAGGAEGDGGSAAAVPSEVAAAAAAKEASSPDDEKMASTSKDARLGRTNFVWNEETHEAQCPSAAAAGTAIDFPSPLSTFTALGANLLVAGDSTDKLWMLAGCSDVLPAKERCDYGNMGIPKVYQIPHNMRSYMCVPGVNGGRCDMHMAQCCGGPSEEQCCMRSDEARTAAACGTRHGAAGTLHILGPGEGPYDDERWESVVKDYEGYGMPRSTPQRVLMGLSNFTRWAAFHEPKKGAVELSPAEKSFKETMERQASSAAFDRMARAKPEEHGAAALAEATAMRPDEQSDGPRPTVVVVNTNYWAQKFGNAETDEFYDEYGKDLKGLVEMVQDYLKRARAHGGGGGCVVLRTQHDMINSEDAGLEKNNAHTRRINDVIRATGTEASVPVFPWDTIFNQQLEDNIFDGWCHQWGDVSLYMMKRFTSWAAVNLPAECFTRGKGWADKKDKRGDDAAAAAAEGAGATGDAGAASKAAGLGGAPAAVDKATMVRRAKAAARRARKGGQPRDFTQQSVDKMLTN